MTKTILMVAVAAMISAPARAEVVSGFEPRAAVAIMELGGEMHGLVKSDAVFRPVSWGGQEEFHQKLLNQGVMGAYLATVENFVQQQGYQIFRGAKIEKLDTASANHKNLRVQVRFEKSRPILHCVPGRPCPQRPLEWFLVEMTGLVTVADGHEIVKLYSVNGSAHSNRN
ncbi:MAG: hypothetical protein HY078_07090 [Elusimicrobia bacterium]|nr:hypothetical protein [Elusimicrobiota bacterium]